MTTEIEGDGASIRCPCGQEWFFESADGGPKEGTEIDCECGKRITVTMVDWSVYVCADVSDISPKVEP